MTEKSAFGSLLKHYRQAAGLTQEALAERAGLSPRAISDLERGINKSPRNATLDLLVKALSLSPAQHDLLRTTARPALDISNHHASIPIPPTRLIGRNIERTQALDWLGRGKTRLLTLTGPSGVGKTHMALQLAQELEGSFTNGVVYVPLDLVRDPALVPRALAQVLGVHEKPYMSIQEQILADLQTKDMLLVLDNLEQILDCSPFIASLLAACPRLAILATSRSPLRLRAEQELLLAPLGLEDAVELFRERAQAIRPGMLISTDEIASICDQLDCLPLAIELAAMQVRALSFSELRRRLAHRFSLLKAGARDLPARQQTMENALAWSYELLTGLQQRCFRAMGVFAGGWTLEAAKAVCCGEDEMATEDLLPTLSALVEASLVQTEVQARGEGRFSMLMLMRDYALECLEVAGETEMFQHRHAAYYARLADAATAIFESGHPDPDLSLARELPNVEAALVWTEINREAELGLKLCGFSRLWHILGQPSQMALWLGHMLALDRWARENGKSVAPLTMRIERLYSLGRVLLSLGQLERAEAAAREALALAQNIGDERGLSSAWTTLGLIAQVNNKLEDAKNAFTLAAQHADQTGENQLRYWALFQLGELARGQGEFTQAADFLEQALSAAQSKQMTWDVAMFTTVLGLLAYQERNYSLAKEHFHKSLRLLSAFRSPTYLAWCLEGYAAVLVSEGQAASATRLCAAASRLRKQAGTPLPAREAETVEQAMAQARGKLGQQAFDREWEIGSRLTQNEAVEMALKDAE